MWAFYMCTWSVHTIFHWLNWYPNVLNPRSNKQNEGCSVLLSFLQDLKNDTYKLRIQIKYMQVKFLQSSIPGIMGWNPFWNSIPISMLMHFYKIFVQFSGCLNLNESWNSCEWKYEYSFRMDFTLCSAKAWEQLVSKLCYIPSTIDSNKISFSGQWGQTLSKVLHILINRTCCSLIIN